MDGIVEWSPIFETGALNNAQIDHDCDIDTEYVHALLYPTSFGELEKAEDRLLQNMERPLTPNIQILKYGVDKLFFNSLRYYPYSFILFDYVTTCTKRTEQPTSNEDRLFKLKWKLV